MTPYETPGALRDGLEARLRSESIAAGLAYDRLSRRAAFERLLVRLEHASPGRWILKGAVALEVRLRERARTTRDLDLAVRLDGEDGDAVRELLIEALADDVEGDGFEFRVAAPRPIAADEAGRPGWKFTVDVRLDGRTFAEILVEVVARADEITGTERVLLPGVLAFAGFPPNEVEAVDPAQHFAEKLHAFTRTYGERPNTRVKDLPDLVLLIEEGLGPAAARAAAEHVFAVRATHPLPLAPPDPPVAWTAEYARRVEEMGISARTVGDAMAVVRAFWAEALATRKGH